MVSDFNSGEHLRWERECLQRVRQGERQAFAELYRVFAPPLYREILLPRLGQRQAAEDALSETFRVALEKLAQYADRGTSLYFWLARIALNKAMDMHRASAATGRALVNLTQDVERPAQEADLSPHALLELRRGAEQSSQEVDFCMSKLNARYRTVLELRFFKECPREQCAAELDVKLGTLDVLVLRSLRAFRKEWDKMRHETDAAAMELENARG